MMPGRPSPRARRRPRGIALLMSLVVVMLLTFFMSEYFFATGLELRGMTTFKDAQQARMLSRSVFKAVQLALLQDEVNFFEGYRQVAGLLEFSAVPWNNGLLLTLQVEPQDHLYNLNNMAGLQPGSVAEICRSEIFRKSAGALVLAREEAGSTPPGTPPPDVDALYAAVFDWLDGDDEVHVEVPGVLGAEAGAYFSTDPEYTIKNAQLDRLTEVRLVRGAQSLLWGEWVANFAALPKAKSGQYCNLSEHINVNTASAAQIESFLRAREIAPDGRWSAQDQQIQEGINEYAEKAAEVAQAFAPEGEERESFTDKTLLTKLKEIGLKENYGKTYLLSTVNETYRVTIVTEVAGVRARLQGMLQIPRDGSTRMAKGTAKVLWLSMN